MKQSHITKSIIVAISMLCQGAFAQSYDPLQQQNQHPSQGKRYVKKTTEQQQSSTKPTDMEDQSFYQMSQNLFPMSPNQIKDLRRIYNQTQQAAAFTEDVPAKPTSSSLVVDLTPGSTPPVVRLASGYVTSIVFLDATGAPWPIKAYNIGDPKVFNIQWNQDAKPDLENGEAFGNTLLVQANSLYKQGNLAVILKGLNTPIMITLMPGQDEVDYRVDMQVPRDGPQAYPQINPFPSATNADLLNVLNRVSPKGAKSLQVEGGWADAWLSGNRLYVRTQLDIVSPAWIGKMSSADQMVHAYELTPVPILLGLFHGKMVTVNVKGL
jgi:intracellular multiplication protein IcmK